jgi:hypothetical protein
MSDKPDEKPDIPDPDAALRRERNKAIMKELIRKAEEAVPRDKDDGRIDEILFYPENKYGTPYPEGTEMDFETLRKLCCSRPASMLVQ